jgi:Lon protease-like protein
MAEHGHIPLFPLHTVLFPGGPLPAINFVKFG